MFALNLLGGASLSGLNGPVDGKAAHKRRIALLAILAVARGRTVGRERIIGLLWADHRTAAARHLLSESLYVLRKELGADAFVSAGDEVGLNGAVVQSDVEAFELQVEQGGLERAAQLYRGPFLDGFFVPGAVEFEQWAEGERARLARAHSRVLECLAETAEAAERPEQAAEWWRRLMVLDPSNTRVGMRLMTALDAAGERGAALWFAQSHVAWLDAELGVEPEDEFLDLVERLRTEPVRVPRRSRPSALDDPRLPVHAADERPPGPGESARSETTAPTGEPMPQAAPAARSAQADPADAILATSDLALSDSRTANSSPLNQRSSDPAPPDPAPPDPAPPDPALSDQALSDPALSDPAPSNLLSSDPLSSDSRPSDPAPFNRAPSSAIPPEVEERGRSAESGHAGAAAPSSPDGAAARDEVDAQVSWREAGEGAAAERTRGDGRVPSAPSRATRTAAEPGRAGQGRRWRRRLGAAVALGMLMGLALAFSRRGDEPPPVAGGFDPRRVAVLYFDDDSRGGELGYLATGLTEALIHTLSQVPALEVISRNGVKPYRQGNVPFARMVGDLQAGTVVEGSVQRSGDSVRVTVVLVDARTQARVESRTLAYRAGDVFTLQDALADSVSVFLRKRVGAEVRLRRTAAETRSAAAWTYVQQARQRMDDAAALQRADDPLTRESVLRLLSGADSLLAAAERADPDWTRPTVQRGWIALRTAPMTRDPDAGRHAALAYAERALSRRPDDPLARELRGGVRFAQVLSATDSAGQAARVRAAEEDLRAAVAADSTLASGWSRLSQVVRYQGRRPEAAALERRAFTQDAWLDDADGILARLFFNALYAADYPQARALCDQGHRRFPADWRFVECSLLLLRADPSRPADPAAVRTLLAELGRMYPAERARREGRAYAPVFHMAVAAGVLARAGQPDSARAMLARARAATAHDPEMRVDLALDEAIAYTLLGDVGTARTLLEWSFTRRPPLRAFAGQHPILKSLAASPSGAPGATTAPPGAPFPSR